MVPSNKKIEFCRRGHKNTYVVYILDAVMELAAENALKIAGYENVTLTPTQENVWAGDVEEVYMGFKVYPPRNAAFASADPDAMERLCAAFRLEDDREHFEVRKQYRP